jgi:Sec-independent protein secretion pathway component TatC
VLTKSTGLLTIGVIIVYYATGIQFSFAFGQYATKQKIHPKMTISNYNLFLNLNQYCTS